VRALLAAVLVLASAGVARAQDVSEEAPARVWHGWFETGGALPIGGPSPGVWAGAGFSGSTWGVCAEAWMFDPASDGRSGLAVGSLSYELGRTERHLVMSGHVGGGARFPDVAPVLTAGVHTQLGLMKDGPLVLGSDLGLHVDLGELPLDVYFVATLSLGLAF
jgi:hypothetical protein